MEPANRMFGGQQPTRDTISSSQWLNIPMAYVQNAQLSRSLRPFIALTILLTAAEHLPIFSETVDASMYTANIPMPQDLPWMVSATDAVTAVTEPLTLSIDFGKLLSTVQQVTDFLSVLMLIRMTKIIGADRDVIIADKVLAACREFPVSSSRRYIYSVIIFSLLL